MNVDPLGRYRPAIQKTSTRSTSGAAFAQFTALVDGDTAPASAASGVSMASGLEMLLAAQQVEMPGERAERGRKRATQLLDLLDRIRLALLDGGLDAADLSSLHRLASTSRDEIDDPRLREILDDIDMRAQIELAKLEAGGLSLSA